ncbi:MAG: helix-turn-helix domain-containing protein, partial [Haliscomenobacter sp.]
VYVFLGILPYDFFTDWEYKLKIGAAVAENWHNLPAKFPNPNRLISPYWNERLRIVHGLLYAALCWGLVFRYRANLFHNRKKSQHVRLMIRWIVLLCLMFSLLMVVRAVQGYYMLTIFNKNQFFQVSKDLILICGVGYVLLNITLLLFPHIFYGLPVLLEGIQPEEGPPSLHKTGEAEADRSEAKYNGSYSASTASFYRDKVENGLTLWIGTKVYVSRDVSLHELSREVDIPAHHLSYYFNQVLQQRFTDWKNKLKIEYACARIQEGALQKQTIESLAMECGFNSKPTFNRAFRELTGQTPSAYAEKIDSGS